MGGGRGDSSGGRQCSRTESGWMYNRTLTGVNFTVRKLYLSKAVVFYLSGMEMGKQEVRRNAASSRSWDPSRALREPCFAIHGKPK